MSESNVNVAVPEAIPSSEAPVSRFYAWIVFAIIFFLMLSDYMTRQVIGPMFSLIKADWMLSDSQLGMLVSIVTLAVGVTTIPLALVADRWGRVKSVTLMAFAWCLATIACGLSESYEQMLTARFIVGLGEGAYAAAGAALLVHAFPARQRSFILGAFTSGGMFGSVLGAMLGGVLAAKYGWRTAFIIVGAPGLLIAALFPFLVRDYKTAKLAYNNQAGERVAALGRVGQIVREIFGARSGNFCFIAFGLQMGMPITLITWMPTYFNRFFGMDVKQAGLVTAGVVLAGGVGMALGGGLTDRLSRNNPRNRALLPAAYVVLTGILLITAFALPPSSLALTMIILGSLFSAAHAGPSTAIVVDVTHPGVRSTVTATLVVFGNLIGQALAPFVVGLMSDLFSLKGALTIIPVVSFGSALFFILASRTIEADAAKHKAEEPPDEPAKH